MSFLEINGLEIPVSLGGEEDITEFGDRSEGFSGRRRANIRSTKRDYRFTTPPLREKAAELIARAVRGEGDKWEFNGTTYSDKGIPENNVVNTYTFRENSSMDTFPTPIVVYDDKLGGFVDPAKFGQSIYVDNGTTNFLTDAQATMEPSGVAAWNSHNGALLFDVNTLYVEGTQSLAVTTSGPLTDGDQEGIWQDFNPGGGPGQDVTVSCYVWPLIAGQSIRILIRDIINGGPDTIIDYVLPTGLQWHRIHATKTLSAASSQVRIFIMESAGDSGYTYIVDGVQAELSSFPTTFTKGTRAAGRLDSLPVTFPRENRDLTAAVWTRGPPQGLTDLRTILNISDSTDGFPRFEILAEDNNSTINRVRFLTSSDGTVASSLILNYNAAWDGDWHHIACVYRHDPEDGNPHKEIYYDGALVASKVITLPGEFLTTNAEYNRALWGSFGTSRQLNGPLDQSIIVPYAASAEQILAWYSLGADMPTWPFVRASGDFTSREYMEMLGETRSADFGQFATKQGTWVNNYRQVDFMLKER